MITHDVDNQFILFFFQLMKKYQVKILALDGSFKEETRIFQLEDNATVEDLKKAFSEADYVYHPDQLRLSYETASGKVCKYQIIDLLGFFSCLKKL